MAGNATMEQLIRQGGGLDHLCLEVENLDQTLEELRNHGIKLRGDAPQVLPGRKIAFVDPSEADGVLLEFYELT
jgi:catechol 2,3-dioxygenase-like lactoylglutathione lyase family enzyme